MRVKTYPLLIYVCLVLLGQSIQAQESKNAYNEKYDEILLLRQPSARSEAMGRGYVAAGEDIYSVYYNPAGIARTKGLQFNSTYTPSPILGRNNAFYQFFGLSGKISQYFTLALSNFSFNFGDPAIDRQDNRHGTPLLKNYKLTAASQPIKNLFVGISANYLRKRNFSIRHASTYLDIGAIKTVDFNIGDNLRNKISAGASIINVSFGKMAISTDETQLGTQTLPVIARAGVGYNIALTHELFTIEMDIIDVLLHFEYQNLLNYEYFTAYRGGCEVKLFEILALRAGTFAESVFDYGFPDFNFSTLSDFTYGFGLIVPFSKLTHERFNVDFFFDYTSLPQLGRSKINNEWKNFNTFNAGVNWKITIAD